MSDRRIAKGTNDVSIAAISLQDVATAGADR